MSSTRQLRLGAFMRPASIHTGAWRYPDAWPDMNFNFAHMKRSIQALERAKFDAFFMADHMAVLNVPLDALKRSHTVTSFEPFTLLSALSQVTNHIGLVATGSTPSTPLITLRAASPRWITSVAAAPAGTSSPPRTRMRRSISGWTSTWSTASATVAPASSTTW
jgi:hypothetical protein